MKKLLADTYKAVIGNAELMLTGLKNDPSELMVLCMHSTPKDRLHDFSNLCDRLMRHFKPIRASEIGDWFDGRLSDGPYLLFTFDDGLKNNLGAAEILNKRNITAYFFLVPAFMEASDGRLYYRTNIRKVIDPAYDHEPEDFLPMNVEDIKGLLSHGHKIGSHTMTHLLRSGMDHEQIRYEIAGSREWLQRTFSTDADAFCSPINTTMSVDQYAKEIIRKEYRFHFTTYPGLNAEFRDPQMICRRNIETDWSFGKISFAAGRWDLKRWRAGIEQFRSL
jgi:peptidoglycan/xylan/chitin deacetylase (PgdA/CDA1 family)